MDIAMEHAPIDICTKAAWDFGRQYAKEQSTLPESDEIRRRWLLTDWQAVLFIFGFHEENGQLYPEGFRGRIEFALRHRRNKIDALAIALNRASGDDAGKLIDQIGLDGIRKMDAWTDFIDRWGDAIRNGKVESEEG